MAELHILVPGLYGPLPPEVRDSSLMQFRLPALERVLARAQRQELSRSHLFDQLAELFELTGDELPAGALGWLGEGGDPGEAHWLRADPVHLQPDRDQLMLFDAAALAIDGDEAAALIRTCNDLLREDELELLAPAPDRWYLRLNSPTRLRTTPTQEVAGRYLGDYLPRGEDAGRWLALTTELQMLLHQASPNQRRDDAGMLTVNGIWLWGAGRLPERAAGGWRQVLADEPTARGLAKVCGVTPVAVPADAGELEFEGRCLLVLTGVQDALRAGDLERWRHELGVLERQWIAPAVARLQAGELNSLIIQAGGLRLTVGRRDLYRVWRRPRPLARYVES